jgi:ubiquinone/menaquinone biosynthesis C-methylase UbiE
LSENPKKKLERALYINSVFSVGIEPYIKSLEKHGIVGKKAILDVGCGPGQWTFAAAILNPEALVVGVDMDEVFLDFAIKYARDNTIKNCKFLKESYENLTRLFQPESFDVVMCNSVIQYINEKKAFQIFSCLLKKKGILIMFYNHGPGYYLKRLLLGIRNLNFGDVFTGFYILIFRRLWKCFLNLKTQDHFVTLRHLQKISEDVGIILGRIQTEPKLNYTDRFLGFTYVFSCKGIKT